MNGTRALVTLAGDDITLHPAAKVEHDGTHLAVRMHNMALITTRDSSLGTDERNAFIDLYRAARRQRITVGRYRPKMKRRGRGRHPQLDVVVLVSGLDRGIITHTCFHA